MIVYGWNSFLLHKCKPSQLGMPAEIDATFQIERRQKYFHLFWIPFFGIGKVWLLRKHADNQLYEPTHELLSVLQSLSYNEKTPWYTFALPLLILAGSIIWFIGDRVSDYQRHKRYERETAERVVRFTNAVNNPEANTYYTLQEDNYENAYLKVLSSNAANITCVYSSMKEYKDYDQRMLEAFADAPKLDTVVVNKQDLLKAIDDEKGTVSFKGYPVVNGKGNFTLSEVTIINYPVFRKTMVQYEEGTYMAMLQNIGAAALLKTLNTEDSNLTFEGSILPDKIAGGQSFIVNGKYSGMEPKARAKVQFEAVGSATAKDFELWISGTYFTLKPNR